jgi:PAS domain S-box-containing protein
MRDISAYPVNEFVRTLSCGSALSMSPHQSRAGEASATAAASGHVEEERSPNKACVDDVIDNGRLRNRPARPPDYRAENEALCTLAKGIAEGPATILHLLVETALRLCGAHSAGLSLLEEHKGSAVFRWRATVGAFGPLKGSTLPRDFSPCGVVVDRDALQLMIRPDRFYGYVAELSHPVEEVLLVPFHLGKKAVGTLWVVSHDGSKQFDGEDARIATSLAQFAAPAWQALQSREEVEESRRALHAQTVEQAKARSELEDTRQEARRVQAMFEGFFEQSPFYAGILSTRGEVCEIGRRALEVCGYRPEDVLGKLFWETGWWHGSKQVQEQVKSGFAAVLRGETYKAQLPYYFADGSEHITDFGLSPIRDESGAVMFVIATGNDITERVRTERELAAARVRLESALIAGELGIYEWDVVANRLYGNENFLRLFNVCVDEAGGAALEAYLAVIHPDDRTRVRECVARSVRTGENFETDYRVVRPDGERWMNSRGRMFKNAGGQVVSFFGVVLDITSRKLAEQEREAIADELRRLSAIHETVLSSTDDFAYVFDRQGRFLYANRRLLTVWARTLGDVVGKTCYDLGYPTWHADMHMREIAEVIATRKAIRGEVPFTGDSGISGIYDYIFTPVFGPDGEVELIAGTTRDVTERRMGEDRDRFLVALDDATRPLTDAVEITQTSARLLGEYLNVNRCAYADVEADANTFNLTGDYNRGVPSIVGRYRFDQFGDECLRLMRAGQPYVVEDARKDPRTAAVRASYEATLIRSVICVSLLKAGQFVGAMAVHQKVPRAWKPSEVEIVQLVANRCWESIERTRVMRVLAASEQQLRLAVETGRLGVWEMDLQHEMLTCSAQGRANYGRSAEAPFSYADFWQAVHPEDRDRLRAAVRRAVEERVDLDLEYQTLWPDGSIHWVLVRGQTSYAPDGSPLSLVGVSLDITERKRAERELTRLHDEAVRASRAKDDFLAALSHELRTPLNPVLLLASDAARDAELPPRAREAFEVIRKNVELEARLIDDLLDLTGIVRGKLTVVKKVVAVHEVVREAAEAMHGEFAAKKIELLLELGAARDLVHADSVRLLQVLLNLLRNAVKFTAEGRVTLSTQLSSPEELEIRVVDTGIGMTPAELTRAFGAFEQGDHAAGATAHRYGGLGLGLAIARRLVELHGGSIHATSEGRGLGSMFVVRLPLTTESQHAEPRPATPDVSRDADPNGSHRRVLLVEDHEATRSALAQLLRRRGYAITPAASVAEARACAENGRFDFVISDIGLPDGDGADLMNDLRTQFGLKGIALTGYGMEHDIARCHAAGFVAHLTKPVRMESLEAALAEIQELGTV